MRVRPYLSQHETAKQLPLISESATVTEIEGMDRSRNDAVIRAIKNTLDERAASLGNESGRQTSGLVVDGSVITWIRSSGARH